MFARTTALLLVCTTLLACERPGAEQAGPAGQAKNNTAPSAAASAPAASSVAAPPAVPAPSASGPSTPGISFAIVKDAAKVPAFAKTTGKLELAITWTDKNGQNAATFGRRKGQAKDDDGTMFNSEYLTVEHTVSQGGATRTLRTVNDHVDKCELDLILTVLDASLSVTDLDGDGMGELTFGYKLACVSDVSPVDMKLLMLENGDKYILRGTDRIPKMGSEPAMGGSYKVDPSFQNAPPTFLPHAKAVWERIKRR